MKKYIILIILSLLLIGSTQVIAGKENSNVLNSKELAMFWDCWKEECKTIYSEARESGDYTQYQKCSNKCYEEAQSNSDRPWCSDSDGNDYFTKGKVTSNIYQRGIEDRCHTFSNGKTYLFESVCKNNKYVRMQKKCTSLGSDYVCEDGACVQRFCDIHEVENGDVSSYPDCEISCNEGYILEEGICVQRLCDIQEVENGIVSAYPECEFSCNEGYVLEEGACVMDNNAPVLDNIENQEINEGEMLSFIVNATDTEGDILSYSAENLPEMATFDGQEFSWTPGYDQAGEYEVIFIVTDGEYEVSIAVVITVIDTPNLTHEVIWQKEFGRHVRDVEEDDNGGFFITGHTNQNDDGYFIHLDSNGEQLLTKLIGQEDRDFFLSMDRTNDGNFILAGHTYSYDAVLNDGWLVKVDINGEIIWNKTYGGDGEDSFWKVIGTSDNGFILVGQSNRQGWLLKTDSEGEEEWNKSIMGTKLLDIIQTNDGFITLTSGGYKSYLIKTNNVGEEEWRKTYNDSRMYSIKQTSDNGYIMAGGGSSEDNRVDDLKIMKIDSQGNVQWTNSFGDEFSDAAGEISLTNDGGYIIAGHTYGFEGNAGSWLIKVDQNGTEEWNKVFGSRQDYFSSVMETSNGDYIASGSLNGNRNGVLMLVSN
jgi:hypothetical protein